MTGRPWSVQRVRGGAAELHALGLPEGPARLVRVLEVDRPALVLGSTQSPALADAGACAAAGVEVVSRRSGGGAVLVEPGAMVWVDVVVPAGDPLWSVDVGRAFLWLGESWSRALGGLGAGVPALRVHRGALVCPDPWGRLVCFAGVGPGEVVVDDSRGAKVVGMAQRRTRAGALFHCAVPLAWDPTALVALLALSADERGAAGAQLAGAVAPLAGAAPVEVVSALLAQLPA